MTLLPFQDHDVAVVLPCFNEEVSIGEVVRAFRAALPDARIYVYDNNSTDRTAERAAQAGAVVVPSLRQGKGNVVRQIFADIDADLYVMADGDGTYDASIAPAMIERLLEERVDMVVATRAGVTRDAGRNGHAFGNRMFNILFRLLFGRDFTDIFSGYRVFTRRFAKSFPALSPQFEIETEMSVHAASLRLPVAEIESIYGRREEGSTSKLSTFRDGFRILQMMGMLTKETRPFLFFSLIAIGLAMVSSGFMSPVLYEYFATGLVTRIPTWILAMTLLLGAMLVFAAGIVLDSLARSRIEAKRIHYLSLPACRGDSLSRQTNPIPDRRNAAQRKAS